jgi:hypothetical protein
VVSWERREKGGRMSNIHVNGIYLPVEGGVLAAVRTAGGEAQFT